MPDKKKEGGFRQGYVDFIYGMVSAPSKYLCDHFDQAVQLVQLQIERKSSDDGEL